MTTRQDRDSPLSTGTACLACVRRSWLLAELSPLLDLNCRADGRLFELLTLVDEDLIQAIGGRRRDELRRRHAAFGADQLQHVGGVRQVCAHARRYPRELRCSGICSLLHLTGSLEGLAELTRRPVVAIAGTRRASDYGFSVARDLAGGLSASGVTVAAMRADGVAAAALMGALEGAGGGVLSVSGSGLDIAPVARHRSLYAGLEREGCAVSELPCGVRGRRWGVAAAERALVGLATVTLVVEAEDSRRDLAAARFAQSLGRPVAAIPGRVTSPVSSGCHALIGEGARLITSAEDVLELLFEAGRPPSVETSASPPAELAPRLQALLERVGAGADTPGKLAGAADDVGEALRGLSELELLGLLKRGDGGRYIPVQCALPPGADGALR